MRVQWLKNCPRPRLIPPHLKGSLLCQNFVSTQSATAVKVVFHVGSFLRRVARAETTIIEHTELLRDSDYRCEACALMARLRREENARQAMLLAASGEVDPGIVVHPKPWRDALGSSSSFGAPYPYMRYAHRLGPMVCCWQPCSLKRFVHHWQL